MSCLGSYSCSVLVSTVLRLAPQRLPRNRSFPTSWIDALFGVCKYDLMYVGKEWRYVCDSRGTGMMLNARMQKEVNEDEQVVKAVLTPKVKECNKSESQLF